MIIICPYCHWAVYDLEKHLKGWGNPKDAFHYAMHRKYFEELERLEEQKRAEKIKETEGR